MNRIFRISIIIISIILLVSCSAGQEESQSTSKEVETENEKVENEQDEEPEDKQTEEDNNQEEKEEIDEEEFLTEKELNEQIEQQPLKVISKNYLVQDDRHKSLYPDMLQVIIENNSGEDIKDAVIAYVAWDEHGLPLKIESSFELHGGKYTYLINAEDINLPDGGTYGENSGFEISEDMDQIEEFEAIVVSYETFEGKSWENEYLDDFKELYEGEKRK